MQSDEIVIEKVFEVINEQDCKTTRVKVKVIYIPQSREINIGRAVTSIHQSGINLYNSHIFYMDFNRKMYVHIGQYPFLQDITLKYQLFLDDAIKLRYRRILPESPPQITPAPCPKPKKIKERTIKEAMSFVECWRKLYDTIDPSGKRIHTLESAATVIGMAKKTLDDYFYQLKLAQEAGFSFYLHSQAKIGVLRNFVRDYLRRKKQGEETDSISKYIASSSESEEDERRR